MESFLNRYRNITVLLLVIFAQLVLLAVQVKNDQDVRMIRVWTVTAVTPVARVIEGLRGGSIGFVRNYILLHQADADNRRLQAQVNQLKLENIFLKNELSTADRAKALQIFQAHTPSKAVAASIIGTGAGTNSKVMFIDRGSAAGIERGMAVVTPEGIVGKVIASYPTAAEVLLVTDPDFGAGVISQKTQLRGTLKGQGTPMCRVDYIPNEEKIQPGEWFYTSGDDRVFPRGFPVGVIKAVHDGQPFKEIFVEPSGLQKGLEDVMILVESVHQAIPDTPPGNQPMYMAPPPPDTAGNPADGIGGAAPTTAPGTDADKLRTQYKAVGEAQGHKFGEGLPGSKPPDFNLKLPAAGGTGAGGRGQAPGSAPPANAPPPANSPGRGPVAAPAAPAGRGTPPPPPGTAAPQNPPAQSAKPVGAGR